MIKKGIVVIVGRPNVGKSTLFNRIIKNRISIVDDVPGVTRDRIYSYAKWLTREFLVVDTGGIIIGSGIDSGSTISSSLIKEVKIQTEIAINEADIIVFVVSYSEGITKNDEMIMKLLYKFKKPTILVVNKYDKYNKEDDFCELYRFMSFGLGEPVIVSSLHGIGINYLLDKIVDFLDESLIKFRVETDFICFSIVGKQNVGKSSLINTILDEKRVVVSDFSGTTTDAVDIQFERNDKKYTVIDTAGIRRKSKIYDRLEKYSIFKTIDAIKKSDIVLLILDGSMSITDQDVSIGGLISNYKKPVVIVVNKLDKFSDDINNKSKMICKIRQDIKTHFKFLNYAKLVFVSALENKKINDLFITINDVYECSNKRIKTSDLNKVLINAQLLNPSPNYNGGRLKIYYATQPETNIPTFVLFCNNPKYSHFSYERFINNQIRNQFNFYGVPINVIFRKRE